MWVLMFLRYREHNGDNIPFLCPVAGHVASKPGHCVLSCLHNEHPSGKTATSSACLCLFVVFGKCAVSQIAILPVLDVAPKDRAQQHQMGRGQKPATHPQTTHSRRQLPPVLPLSPHPEDLLGELEFGVVDAVLDEDGEIWGHLAEKLAEEAQTKCV